ncbi:MAG TPA: hypothetical protein VGM78_02100 [Ilumatobacteraceae bacterium]
MRALKRFGAFWWDFIVGDDWTTAVGVVVTATLTWFAAHHHVTAWPIMVLGTSLILTSSIWRRRPTRR